MVNVSTKNNINNNLYHSMINLVLVSHFVYREGSAFFSVVKCNESEDTQHAFILRVV